MDTKLTKFCGLNTFTDEINTKYMAKCDEPVDKEHNKETFHENTLLFTRKIY